MSFFRHDNVCCNSSPFPCYAGHRRRVPSRAARKKGFHFPIFRLSRKFSLSLLSFFNGILLEIQSLKFDFHIFGIVVFKCAENCESVRAKSSFHNSVDRTKSGSFIVGKFFCAHHSSSERTVGWITSRRGWTFARRSAHYFLSGFSFACHATRCKPLQMNARPTSLFVPCLSLSLTFIP